MQTFCRIHFLARDFDLRPVAPRSPRDEVVHVVHQLRRVPSFERQDDRKRREHGELGVELVNVFQIVGADAHGVDEGITRVVLDGFLGNRDVRDIDGRLSKRSSILINCDQRLMGRTQCTGEKWARFKKRPGDIFRRFQLRRKGQKAVKRASS